MDLDNSNHKYFTRSKGSVDNRTYKIKKDRKKSKRKTKPKKVHIIKKINHHDEDQINFRELYNIHKKRIKRKQMNKARELHQIKSKTNTKTKTKGTPAIKKISLKENNKSDSQNMQINMDESATSILTAIVLGKALNKLKTMDPDWKSDDSDDEDYVPLEGLPDEIVYIEEEEEYIKKLSEVERGNLLFMEHEILNYSKAEIPQRFKILKSESLNMGTKVNIIKKLDHFYTLDETENEYSKLSQWVDGLNAIPFDLFSKPVCKITDRSNKIIKHLSNARKALDKAVFGHEIAKSQIIQIIAQQLTNPNCSGNCIAIQGPPGNGKTTLVKEGICEAIGKPFAFIALGGMQNSEFMLGHDYTYEGAKCGRIVEILQECKAMDPVIYFDELDKLSEGPKGQEIANLLCHLTDLSQNKQFHDKYFSGIDFDISKALFIFSYNDPSKINPILLDRMIKINTKGFSSAHKLCIAKDYLIPKVCKSIGLNTSDVKFPDDVITNIILNNTEDEKGVRNLKRCLETIVSKINVLRLLNGYNVNVANITSECNEVEVIKNKNKAEKINQFISEIKQKKAEKKGEKAGKKRKKLNTKNIFQNLDKKIKNESKKKTYEEYAEDVLDLTGKEKTDWVNSQLDDGDEPKKLSRKNKRNRIESKKSKIKKRRISIQIEDAKTNMTVSSIIKDEGKNTPVKDTTNNDKSLENVGKSDDINETSPDKLLGEKSKNENTSEKSKKESNEVILETIIEKVELISPEDKQSIVEFDIKNFKLPIIITNDIANKFLKKEETDISKLMMYM